MEHYNGVKLSYTGYGYDNRQQETYNQIGNQVAPNTSLPRTMYNGWGFNMFQQPTESNYQSFSAQNLSSAKKTIYEDQKEEDDFERSVQMDSEHEYSHRNEKFAPSWTQSNCGDIEKSPKPTIRNSFMYNEDNWSSISMSENKNQKLPANLMTLARPINLSNDYNFVVKDIYQKTVPIKMKDINRGEWKADIIVKIKSKTDTNLQKNTLVLELTEEENPLFLYTWEIGETEFHSIRQDQQIRVEFHKLAEYLAELLNSCIKSHQGHEQNSTYECLLSTTTSKVATFAIEEHTRFKDISLIVLKFITASDQDKLRFLSTQLKEFKKQVESLTEQRDQKSSDLESINREYMKMVSPLLIR